MSTTIPTTTQFNGITNKSSSILSDNENGQKREQQIFLRKFNNDFINYKKTLNEKLDKLRETRLQDLIKTEKPIADNSCIDLDNKIYIYNNLTLILGLMFVMVAVILFFANYQD